MVVILPLICLLMTCSLCDPKPSSSSSSHMDAVVADTRLLNAAGFQRAILVIQLRLGGGLEGFQNMLMKVRSQDRVGERAIL